MHLLALHLLIVQELKNEKHALWINVQKQTQKVVGRRFATVPTLKGAQIINNAFLTLAQLLLALWLAVRMQKKNYFVAVASVRLSHQGRFYNWIKIFYPVIQQYEITCVLFIYLII